MLIALLAAKGPLDTWSPTFIELLALFAPLGAFILILTFTIDARRVSAWIAILFTAAALLAAVLVLAIELAHPLHLERQSTYLTFFTNEAGTSAQFKLEWGVVADGLAAVMLVVVTAISLIVQLYARESMRGDSGYVRFFVMTALLTFATEGVVLADNFFALLFFWLLISACSYVLIGHWWQRPSAASAARKAFIVTLIGDAGLLIGICYIYFRFGELNFQTLAHQWTGGKVSATGLFIMAALLLAAAVGKSAQFPLHVWLPDSTEAPPPTAAFLQAAGMAIAGGYLVARTFSLFQVSPRSLLAVGLVGGGTAVLAGLWALGERSLMRVIAYLTISQMGLVFLALAARGVGAAAFQLVTHAVFTACVILVAANLVSVMRTDSLFEMGGLWRRVPLTAWTMLIGTAALVGIPPLSGFWSQTAIAARLIQNGNAVLMVLAIVALFLSGLAAFRLYFLVFTGETVRRRRFEIDRIREPRSPLTTPPMVLAVVAAVVGVIGIPQLSRNVVSFVTLPARSGYAITGQAVALATLPVVAGVVVAWLIYGQKVVSTGVLARRLAPAYGPLRHAFFVDFAYRQSVRRGLVPLAKAANRVERWVDHILDRGGALTGTLGGVRVPTSRRIQTTWVGLLAGLVAMAALALVVAWGWIKVKG
jgi:NADH-quinone oxidoreductase subunit L